jgi:hypothetical protein
MSTAIGSSAPVVRNFDVQNPGAIPHRLEREIEDILTLILDLLQQIARDKRDRQTEQAINHEVRLIAAKDKSIKTYEKTWCKFIMNWASPLLQGVGCIAGYQAENTIKIFELAGHAAEAANKQIYELDDQKCRTQGDFEAQLEESRRGKADGDARDAKREVSEREQQILEKLSLARQLIMQMR